MDLHLLGALETWELRESWDPMERRRTGRDPPSCKEPREVMDRRLVLELVSSQESAMAPSRLVGGGSMVMVGTPTPTPGACPSPPWAPCKMEDPDLSSCAPWDPKTPSIPMSPGLLTDADHTATRDHSNAPDLAAAPDLPAAPDVPAAPSAACQGR